MATYSEKLKSIQELLKKGVVPPPETVRAFLLWFGVERRGYRAVHTIRAHLTKHNIKTIPDFEFTYIDGAITFAKADAAIPPEDNVGAAIADPTYRIGRLESANRKPKYVAPTSKLEEAVTMMLTNDFSQLPVQTSERDVKGIVSWRTIGSVLALGKQCATVADCMEPAQIVEYDDSLLACIGAMERSDYALVRARDKTICGIVTASDFSSQFKILAEPFLLVGEVENNIRRLIHGRFTEAELKSVIDPSDAGRPVEGISDLTFGEYIRLLQDDKRWQKVGIKIDRKQFTGRLDEVREIRNDLMHFDPEGIEEQDMILLREFAQFLKKLRDAGIM